MGDVGLEEFLAVGFEAEGFVEADGLDLGVDFLARAAEFEGAADEEAHDEVAEALAAAFFEDGDAA